MAGDPHKNTWGGKNNTWGHKPKNNNNSTSKNTGSFNKLGTTIIVGALLFTLANAGYGALVDGALEAKNTVDDVKESVEKADELINKDKTKGKVKSSKDVEIDILDNIDISAEDVKDLLDYLCELEDDQHRISENTIVLDFSAVKNSKSFEKKIINKLDDFGKKYNSDELTIILVDNQDITNDEATSELNRVKQLVADNIGLITSNSEFNSVVFNGVYNKPTAGTLVAVITFIKTS